MTGSARAAGIFLIAFIGVATGLDSGCAPAGPTAGITVTQVESLRDLEAVLPLTPDSVLSRYRNYDSVAFREVYSGKLAEVTALIDSLNGALPSSVRIDTLAIDHSFGALGVAARIRNTIMVSASYFIVFDDPGVLRSVVFHEFGHIQYSRLGADVGLVVDSIWRKLEEGALLYLFHDGEYSGNARFGGHPDENPSELFASAYNLAHNRMNEVNARLTYVDPRHYPVIRRLLVLTGAAPPAAGATSP